MFERRKILSSWYHYLVISYISTHLEVGVPDFVTFSSKHLKFGVVVLVNTMNSESVVIDVTPKRLPGTNVGLNPHGCLRCTIGEDAFINIMKMSPGKRIEHLRSLAASWPVGEDLTNLQDIICNILEKQRTCPLEPLHMTIPPNEYDVLIPDISEGDMLQIGEILGVVNLSPVCDPPVFPIRGIMYGHNVRIFVPLVVKVGQTSINVNFLFDTGSPYSYLREETFKNLGFLESIPSQVVANIHGFSALVHLSHGHFGNVNLLGQDYLRHVGIIATLDYDKLMVTFAG